ncbi:NADH-quinone oxidoreductase subunit N [Chitinophaga nivalis]|uniref:NADH-quinone oxidoreductase subunit N n=1 Tax=Chitinophaga nivalis TaxID=2991709 RepID=A0ABT3IHL6_9BACT|nr:NADH-quinone oxidoreductase subunit N [Chitinophaga nivalis]MCW3466851.1 NADH-quinone oxidoreductase subunit N [Chitinophaga nivalis]MCW3483458.1 NADH-quinone oxidoreductase subunit N [Chitinophaga nivalis]
MSYADFISLGPLITLCAAAVIAMLLVAVWRNHRLVYAFTVLAFLMGLMAIVPAIRYIPHLVPPLLVIDEFSLFNTGLILVAGFIIVLLSFNYFEEREERKEEYYLLLLLATIGAMVLVVSRHFMSLFLGLEILSISLYGLIAYLRARERSDEAGIKYLMLAALSSAFLLFGMALIYAFTGHMDFPGIGAALRQAGYLPVSVMAGFGLMLIGVGFKLGVVPFHMWAPDIYEGAPLPVAAFIATVSKGGMLVLLIRFYQDIHGNDYPMLWWIVAIVAVSSMFVGNWLALMQQNVKRILAYSSIAHMGYILVAFLSGVQTGLEAIAFYLVAYFITSIGAFGVVIVMSSSQQDAETVADYKGLFWRYPWVATIFTAMLLSLAGIPLTAGFIGKFYVVMAGVHGHQWVLLFMLAANSVIGLYYYIRLIAAMFNTPAAGEWVAVKPALPVAGNITLALLMILLVGLGVYPTGMMQLIQQMMKILV